MSKEDKLEVFIACTGALVTTTTQGAIIGSKIGGPAGTKAGAIAGLAAGGLILYLVFRGEEFLPPIINPGE